jgi:xanthine dehydrogenase accessory factor
MESSRTIGMREIRQIVRLWQQGAANALVTLVRVEGSSYRQPGARLLLGKQGEYVGTISGGCLEAEVVRKAAWLIREGSIVERYSTMFDDTAEVPFGLGCGGMVDLLIEPVDTPECCALLAALEGALTGNEAMVLTWLPRDRSELRRAVIAANGDLIYASASLTEAELAKAKTTAQLRVEVESLSSEVFIERTSAPQRLFVFGAGDDAKPVINMAALMGWSISVIDGRAQMARPDRFPEAERVIVASATSSEVGAIRRDDAVVVMTHSYEQDRELLTAVLPLHPRYLGLLGGRHRSSLLVSEVAAILGWTVSACCDCIYAPVGLDLGGDGPEAIALAVIAEVQACCMGKLGVSRTLTPEDIQRYLGEGGTARYLQTQCALDIA